MPDEPKAEPTDDAKDVDVEVVEARWRDTQSVLGLGKRVSLQEVQTLQEEIVPMMPAKGLCMLSARLPEFRMATCHRRGQAGTSRRGISLSSRPVQARNNPPVSVRQASLLRKNQGPPS